MIHKDFALPKIIRLNHFGIMTNQKIPEFSNSLMYKLTYEGKIYQINMSNIQQSNYLLGLFENKTTNDLAEIKFEMEISSLVFEIAMKLLIGEEVLLNKITILPQLFYVFMDLGNLF